MPVATLQTPPGPLVRIDGREYVYFAGTGYLGLQGHPEVIHAATRAAQQYGIGSANSRTAFGATPPLVEVERLAAALFGLDDTFYFASGWLGNHILVQSFGREVTTMFLDECSHDSVFEAARAGGRTCVTFCHRDPDDLRAKLAEHLGPSQRAMVLSDGVFAATGHIAPVGEYYEILKNYPGSALCLDDAHGLATLGENGRGTFEHAGRWRHGVNRVGTAPPPCPALLCCGTLSKAVGGFGGIIPGNQEFMCRVKKQSPHFAGASAPPTPIAAATARAIELILADPDMRVRLWSNVRLLRNGLREMGFDVDESPVPIVCLVLGDAENMRRVQHALMQRGVAIAYMAAYAGLGVEGGLRIAVFATHTEPMIRQLLDELRRLV